MKDYKIRVNSEVENKEAQGIFKILGGAWSEHVKADHYDKEFLYLTNGVIEYDDLLSEFLSIDECKEITLPELRDLVVLKRNDAGDATHKGSITDNVYYVSSDEEVYGFESSAWCFSTVIVADLKPIEKTEMKAKEYLNKETYAYVKTHDLVSKDSNWIEIPEGAESFNYFGNEGNVFFLKNNSEITLYSNETEDWAWQDWGDIDFDGVVCLWSRHTHPEELPFIDDEPSQSLNDQYAEIENVRQSHHEASETADPTIKETLSQRQAQYGDFKDVADTTERLFKTIKDGNSFDGFTNDQRMALYMICSKMARIVNGNPNHKDSWHDIAGYATLIDNELVSEKDMPF